MPSDQKQLGIHYTKEDITEYIAKNTIIPFLLDTTKKKCPAAFEPDGPIWQLLQENPDRYIYAAIRDENYHPTETEREYATRRKRYAEIKALLGAGKLASINDLITYNLDISRFAQDVITNCEEQDLLLAFYQNIEHITILDPACGSGAFLLAALTVLEPLYEACLDRIASCSSLNIPQEFSTLPNYPVPLHFKEQRRYFILKSIICNSLYGVDTVKESIEICKLRLLLKLISGIECLEDIGSLPDIDQNIRVGNALIGFITHPDQPTDEINQEACLGDRYSTHTQLDHVLARQYGIDPQDTLGFEQWCSSHRPFHWCIEFNKVMRNGGFDVIIGNPPYVEYSDVKADYRLLPDAYTTSTCGNLYAYCLERSLELLHEDGRWGMIVPLSGFSTARMRNLQQLVIDRSSCLHLSFLSCDANPSKLFEDVKFRLCIGLASSSPQRNVAPRFIEGEPASILRGSQGELTYHSTKYIRWYAEERDRLFQSLEYCNSTQAMTNRSLPKIGQEIELAILKKISAQPPLRNFMDHGDYPLYYHNCPVNWIRATTFVPRFYSDRDGTRVSSQIRQVNFQSEKLRNAAVCIINSTLFFWFWLVYSDCYHLNKREMGNFPINLNDLVQQLGELLSSLNSNLMQDYKKHSRERSYVYKTTGRVVYDEFYPKLSKPIIDEIDRVLAQYYGFNAEELDFILNYEMKYRMGHSSYRK
jgi:hypothetical protein